MWLSDRRSLLAALLTAPLAACGFTPAYAPGGAADTLQDRFAIAAPDDRNAFDLVERLEERLGRGDAATRALSHDIDVRQVGVAVSPTNAITRFNVIGSVTFSVTDTADGTVLTRGKVSNFTAYSATGTTVSTRAAEIDALRRLMRILADQIVAQLLATSADWAQ